MIYGWQWITSFRTLPGSKLGKAVNYVFNLKEGLMNFLKDGRYALSNNLAERSVRSISIGIFLRVNREQQLTESHILSSKRLKLTT